jgi:enoyl-CoA hydratase
MDRGMTDQLRDLLENEVAAADVTDHVGLQLLADVAIVTLARPEQYNALSLGSWRRLGQVFSELADVTSLRAVVVRGAGSHAFGAGADIKEFGKVRLTPADAIAYNECIAAALNAVQALPVPVIAMIGGLAVGGGCELAAACDVRLASTEARFGIPIGRLGVTLGYAEAAALVRLIGPAELKHLLFGGELIDASEALRIRLVQAVVEPAELIDRTVALIDAVLDSSAVTMRAAKLVTDMCGRTLDAHDTETLTRITIEAYGGPELREGVAAFEQRRPPNFAQLEGNTNGRA